ncbi:MAG: hypothetical protein A2Z72_00670 [Omnitrophica bacterium RBG_13_46_9]|nr:MAG: hypothetical protein A2Z72_00670 [Omnitrophica bacterium RBG_13_46_9]
MANWIRSFARMPVAYHWSEVLGSWDWVMPWVAEIFRDRQVEVVLPLALAVTGCFVVLLSSVRKKYIQRKVSPHGFTAAAPKFRSGKDSCPAPTIRGGALGGTSSRWPFILPAILGIIYWFFTAPHPRFADSFFWILGIGVFILAIDDWVSFNRLARLYFVLCLACALCFFIQGKKDFAKVLICEKNIAKAFGQLCIKNVVFQGKDKFGFHSVPQPDLTEFRTDSGLILYVPREGDQCWNAPLPCTPYPRPYYRLRREGDMRYGFNAYPRDEEDPAVGIHN